MGSGRLKTGSTSNGIIVIDSSQPNMSCVIIRGTLGSNCCSIYGLNSDDLAALVGYLEYEPSGMSVSFDEIDFKLPATRVINGLMADGYRIQFADREQWILIKYTE
ncbi:hypothetical protein O3M35_011559 [Rhynocoris fuscipes]|uniref:Uncharacterized protein n=1 Tax=Rhynocoris fuscipes TaxID=488301 RepID=A0AAW1CX12_9HEMI